MQPDRGLPLFAVADQEGVGRVFPLRGPPAGVNDRREMFFQRVGQTLPQM